MPKKEKIPPPGNKKDEFTNFYSKSKWKQFLLKSTLEVNGFNMRWQGAQIVGNAIAKNKWVTCLDLCNNNIGDQGAVELAQVLKVNDILETVNLSCNGIGDVGGIAIASAFIPYANPTGAPSQWNRGVNSLNLSGNRLTDVALVALANAAAAHRDMSLVDVSNNLIGGTGCKAFLRTMERNPRCTFMLAGNRLGDEGAALVAAAFKAFGSKNLQAVLDLSNNQISKGGADAIGGLLETNDFVERLNLCWNTLGYKGLEALVAQLNPSTCVLKYVNLSYNCLGDDGAIEVAKLIRLNIPTLVNINLQGNQIGSRGAKEIFKACEGNTSLKVLAMGYNDFGDEALDAILSLMGTTETMTSLDMNRVGLSEDGSLKVSNFSKGGKKSEHFSVRPPPDQPVALHLFIEKLGRYIEMNDKKEETGGKKPSKGKGKKK